MSIKVNDIIVIWEIYMEEGFELSFKFVFVLLCYVIFSWTVDMSLLFYIEYDLFINN